MIEPKIEDANEKELIRTIIKIMVKKSMDNEKLMAPVKKIAKGKPISTLNNIFEIIMVFALIGKDLSNQKLLPSKDKDMAEV